ncbi:glyoxylase-like metal-dependent hydrolase (beta-lactamase superfamily II) [Paenibacillus phyllosphaerae]|uniref:Glyoxylase-like metal-dependent hydrolase (Beta-lactamase superfamily II) n=1 Tax=Paenibacillus phyllosphaerae TaxID=274593 RepID=A0A7W5AT24_9BACL|nr:MBL fold metallo-hydrolase [Paenibacillus phyllosphaerae]MBB3108244.1 glyoxylase-like metal-dependent hydrolase (beta-lactamase superfamily II) [Paenibacillus phyllosphaerae]
MTESANVVTGQAREWPGGILQVRIPLPFSLKWVNSYLLQDEQGYTLVDPGLHTEQALDVWKQVLGQERIAFERIHSIVLTHQHPDHFGLAGWFQQQTGAPVYMSEASYAYTRRLWGEERSFAADLTRLYRLHGMPEELQDDIRDHLESFVARVSPMPNVSFIQAGDTLQMGSSSWLAIDAPGHAFGQLCFYDGNRKHMLCGDQVLPDITPNISLVPGEEEDPLASFLRSLQELAAYEVELAFPGHREPFADYQGRIHALLAFHDRRLAYILELLKDRPQHGFALCQTLFGARIAGNAHNLRFAMSETLAHLVHLERQSKVRSREGDGVQIYEITDIA